MATPIKAGNKIPHLRGNPLDSVSLDPIGHHRLPHTLGGFICLHLKVRVGTKGAVAA